MNSLFCFLCSKSDICDNLFRKWIRRSMRNCPNLIKVVTLNVGHYFFLLSLIVADRRHARPNTVKRPYDTVIHFDHYGGSTHSANYCLRRRVVLAWVWVRISEAHAAEINKQATIVIYARWIWKSQTTEGEEATTLRFFFRLRFFLLGRAWFWNEKGIRRKSIKGYLAVVDWYVCVQNSRSVASLMRKLCA